MNGVSGVDHVQSVSAPGVSVVRVKFELSKDLDVAFNEVQAKINQVLPRLPDGTDPPVVAKIEVGGYPLMWLTLSGDRTLQQLNLYAANTLKKRLETVPGVGEVRIGGERRRTEIATDGHRDSRACRHPAGQTGRCPRRHYP